MNEKANAKEHQEASGRIYEHRLRLHEQLHEAACELLSLLDLVKLLRRVVEIADKIMDSDASALLLYDPSTDRLTVEAATGALMRGVGQSAALSKESVVGWIFSNNEPLYVADVLSDQRFYRELDALTRFQTTSILGVPLRSKTKVIGVLEVVTEDERHFTEHDVRLLLALASICTVAIENSFLFQQSDLVAEMVHELRTPLAALTAATHLLGRQDLPEERRTNLAGTIVGQVQWLNQMASDFLELARLESGRVRFAREPVHVGGLVGECLEVIRPQAEAEEITLEYEGDPSLLPVLADRNRLKQLALNLLTNAIKYSRKGDTVRVSVRRDNADVLFIVEDTGRGIPAESIPYIFDRFFRVPDEVGLTSGTGLGLAIAKRIVENHNGSIQVESQPGIGSKFTVRLIGDSTGRGDSE